MELSSGVSTSGLRRFLKHLALVSVKYKDREDAKLGLKKQIKKLKASALGKKTKQKIMDEFRELEQNISLVLEKESEILRMRTGGMVYKDIMREIEENKREVAKINNTLSQLKGRFGEAVDTKSDRENRIKNWRKK